MVQVRCWIISVLVQLREPVLEVENILASTSCMGKDESGGTMRDRRMAEGSGEAGGKEGMDRLGAILVVVFERTDFFRSLYRDRDSVIAREFLMSPVDVLEQLSGSERTMRLLASICWP